MKTLYNGKYHLEFDEALHRYLLNDRRVISVTAILNHDAEPVDDKTKEVIRKAGELGTKFHKFAEGLLHNHLFGLDRPKFLEGYMEGNTAKSFDWWLNYNPQNWIDSERVVYSEKHDYIGTYDGASRDAPKLVTLWDWKTNAAPFKKVKDPEYIARKRLEFAAQTWAYKEAAIEEGIYGDAEIRRCILLVDKIKGSPAQAMLLEPEEGRELWETQLRKWKASQLQETTNVD